jgi:glycosyltransferase involved in cell wall biosynthesis
VVRIPHPVFDPLSEGAVGPPRGTTLLFFGLIRESKGLDLLLRALPAVAERVPDVRLVVAGDPVEPAGPLRELAAATGVSGRIDWRLRFITDPEIPALMDEAAVVVLPYRRIESSGVLATALGHGRPAVVADVGTLGETVREFGAGAVVPPDDVAALAAACTGLLTDEAALAAAAAGTARARKALSWDAVAREHERVYEAVVAARKHK